MLYSLHLLDTLGFLDDLRQMNTPNCSSTSILRSYLQEPENTSTLVRIMSADRSNLNRRNLGIFAAVVLTLLASAIGSSLASST